VDDDIAARHRIADGTDRPEVALDELGADVAQGVRRGRIADDGAA
jgi:hypothetical protein